jgi:hypothetical protein
MFQWSSNGTPPFVYLSYYDGASNIVDKQIAP